MITKSEKEQIKKLRKEIKFNLGADSCSFIKIVTKDNGRYAVLNVKAKNRCGFPACDVDDNLEFKLSP